MAELLKDTFTDSDSTLITAHTPEIGGTWDTGMLETAYGYGANHETACYISGNAVQFSTTDSSPNNHVTCYQETGESDVVITVDFITGSTLANSRASVIFRQVSDGNTLWFNLRPANGDWRLQQEVSGAGTTIVSDTYTYAVDTTYNVRIVLNGSSVKCYIDDVLLVDETITTYQTATQHGLCKNIGSAPETWDNLNIYPLAIDASLSKTLDNATLSSTATVSASGITGTGNITFDPITGSSTGDVLVDGSGNITFGEVTTTSSTQVLVDGSGDITLDPITGSASAYTTTFASGNITFDPITSSSTGNVLVDSDGDVTFEPITGSSTGAVLIDASGNTTFDPVTGSSNGEVLVDGSGNITFGEVTTTSSANVLIDASGDITFDPITGSGTGGISSTGTGDITFDPITGSSTGDVLVDGSSDATFGTITSSSTGEVLVDGSSNVTFGTITGSSTGEVLVDGSGDITLDPITTTSTTQVLVDGSANITFDAITSSGTGTVIAGAQVTLEGFRFRLDDGTETGATWIDSQDVSITHEKNVTCRLRILVDTQSVTGSSDFEVEWSKELEPDVWGDWNPLL